MSNEFLGVSGSSGFCGSAILNEALNQNLKVRSFNRNKGLLSLSNHSYVECDLSNLDSLSVNNFNGLTAFIHAGGIAHQKGTKHDQYMSINYDATVKLFNLCAEAGVKHFIFLSTVAVYGVASAREPLSINSPVNPITDYAKSKLKAEEYILNASQKIDMRVTVLRLPLIYGASPPGSLGLLKLLSALPIPLPFGGIRNKRSMLSVSGLAKITLAISTQKLFIEGLHLLVESNSFSTPSIISSFRSDVARPKWLFSVPSTFLKILFIILLRPKMYEQLTQNLLFISSVDWEEMFK